jgi:uncharacterized membrane protein
MNKKEFIGRLDSPAIEAAIAAAERLTSGEIRVAVAPAAAPEPVPAAQQAFLRLGMARTKHRNAVLIYVAPASRTFAVIGDQGVHEKCGDAFWAELAAAMTGHFQREEFTAGLLHGIGRAATLLAEHFPRAANDDNELPDKVVKE